MDTLFSIAGDRYSLILLRPDTLVDVHPLLTDDTVKKQSLLYGDCNITLSIEGLEKRMVHHPMSNRLYAIQSEGSGYIGLVGIFDIDWIQQRGALALFMPQNNLNQKLFYEPLKLLLIESIVRWNLRKLMAYIFADDQTVATVLKSFGFAIEGTITEMVRWNDECLDVAIMGLLKKNFRFCVNA